MNAAVAQTMVQSSNAGLARKSQGATSNVSVTDPFLQVFMSMISGTEESEATLVENGLSSELAFLLNSTSTSQALLEQQKAILDHFLENLENSESTEEPLSDVFLLDSMIPFLGTDLSTSGNAGIDIGLLATEIKNILNSNGKIDSSTLLNLTEEQKVLFKDFSIEYSQKASGSQTALTGESLSEQSNFLRAIEASKKNLKDSATQEMGVVAQSGNMFEVGNGILDSIKEKSEVIVRNNELFEQVKEGLFKAQNAESGEFTMKLKPESLGEIVVRLVNEGGKQTLHILTSSSKTSMLINEDLVALRDAVKPMQIEVHDAVSSSDGAFDSQMQNMGEFSGQFTNREWNFSSQNSRDNTQNAMNAYEEELEAPPPEIISPDNGLNMYV